MHRNFDLPDVKFLRKSCFIFLGRHAFFEFVTELQVDSSVVLQT